MKGYKGSEISFRPGEKADLSTLVDMENRSFDEVDAFSRGKIDHYLRNPSGSVTVDVIEAWGEAVGYAVYLARRNSRTISLHSICIIPEMRGKGISRIYLERRMLDFRGRFDRVILRVREGNISARKRYTSLGFSQDKVETGYYPDGENAIRMIKSL